MTTTALIPQNYYATSLAGNIGTTDTTIFLNGSVPTNAEGFLEIGEGLSTKEIIYFTSVGANFVTLPSVGAGRGVGGTSAAAHTSGETVKMKLNAEWWKALQNGSSINWTSIGSIGNNLITAPMLATSAITLGYTQITSNFTITSATSTQTQVTGLTVTVTIPAGGRRVKITVFGDALTGPIGTAQNTLSIWDGVVASGTKLASSDVDTVSGSGIVQPCFCMAVVTPSAGSKTYNVGLSTTGGSSGNLTFNAGSTAPAFILVEAI